MRARFLVLLSLVAGATQAQTRDSLSGVLVLAVGNGSAAVEDSLAATFDRELRRVDPSVGKWLRDWRSGMTYLHEYAYPSHNTPLSIADIRAIGLIHHAALVGQLSIVRAGPDVELLLQVVPSRVDPKMTVHISATASTLGLALKELARRAAPALVIELGRAPR